MNAEQTALLKNIIDDFNKAYERFLEVTELPDTSAVKVGFFTALEDIITSTPVPNEDVQAAAMKYVTDAQIISTTEFIEEVENLLLDVVTVRGLATRAAQH